MNIRNYWQSDPAAQRSARAAIAKVALETGYLVAGAVRLYFSDSETPPRTIPVHVTVTVPRGYASDTALAIIRDEAGALCAVWATTPMIVPATHIHELFGVWEETSA